ncbi:two-component system, OmpR family, sensor histidine kinase ChvG [Lutimaribacter pacificus]|uniref:histidine kinase n=1 Tax=Lutimaribacter pacificus TaxID=391948 RepID=A0A1H0I2S0_9RHOB|nr:sensor histidine kinase [Lutimaribacter pacificus]SDO25693.1 two-component system, OmpR family, sensor histidine kinase ChvG [Lutimaribacter pacificus]SHK27506.1 two-component system, OmpR family, sensor histidine kinase ChvG [Lutimaribacter pacificus]
MALAERIKVRDVTPSRDGDVVLGDDYVAPDSTVEKELRVKRARRGMFSLNRSPLTRKIITFNLIALNVLVAGILFLNSSRDSLAVQRANTLVSEAELIADVFEVRLPDGAPVNLATGDGIDVAGTLDSLDLRRGVEVYIYDGNGALAGSFEGLGVAHARDTGTGDDERTIIVDFLTRLWSGLSSIFPSAPGAPPVSPEMQASDMVPAAMAGNTRTITGQNRDGGTLFAVATPIMHNGAAIGVVALANSSSEIDRAVRIERERVLRMFIIATLVSIGLSLVLASTIANPISDLAEAAELGRDRDKRKSGAGGRIRIPDLTARPDEIGRLSGALRGMVAALYDRIDSNEQFAADVAHEIKNPLASLRSAVGSLRMVKKEEHRDKLLDVIDHDVRRLDRLVSDISNASRLDSELVKEEEESFDLIRMISNLSEYLGQQAYEDGIDFITDLPSQPIVIQGLEARLAQVFVNLITNAISFCEEGDAIRVWARQRENRVLVVVEDTGPGIPEQALTKIFKRFYSERPEQQFGNNSGLGLAISKQIVEAHGGVIWAENIRPTDADITSEPLGARFVVGLPV